MRSTVDSIKERLDIVEVVSSYLKLEKAGQNFKAKCPFHTEKTPSFLISPSRQGYYCFGCGQKGDIFSIVEHMEGVDFKGALKILADRAGVEIEYSNRGESKTEKDKIYQSLEDACLFFQSELEKNHDALAYLESRGVNKESIKDWRLGFAPNEWRSAYSNLTAIGYTKEILQKAGLVKTAEGDDKDKTPYDVFRGRIIFPIFDINGRVIAFSGRALEKDTEPKYLNTPETTLFLKSEVLYGLDKAKESIRKSNYAVLVEGQLDLVLSHQAGVKNAVASSGTAFTELHLERLKKLSPRIILAFDGDIAGENAALKSSALSLFLGMEVKIAGLPEGSDPADIAKKNPEDWKEVLRKAVHAIEYVLNKIIKSESDLRKLSKAIDKKVLPMLVLLESSMERAHFVSLISKKSGIKEEIIWEDLRRAKAPDIHRIKSEKDEEIIQEGVGEQVRTLRERIEYDLSQIPDDRKYIEESVGEGSKEKIENLNRKERELIERLERMKIEERVEELRLQIIQGAVEPDATNSEIIRLNQQKDELGRKIV